MTVRERNVTLSQCRSLSLAQLGKAFLLSDKLEPFRSAGSTSLSFALAATAASAAAEAAAAAAQLSTSFQFAVTSQSLRSSSSSAFTVVCIVLRSVQLRLIATGKASCRSRFALSSCASGDRSTTFFARVPLAICLWVASVELCNNLLRQVTTLICNTCRSYRGTQWTSLQVCANLCKSVQIRASENSWTYAPSLICLLTWLDLFYVPITPRHMPSTGCPFFDFYCRAALWDLFSCLLPPLTLSLYLPSSSGSLVFA